jgi:O-antigen ligase
MNLRIRTINYFYLTMVILWDPLQIAYIKVDGMGRIMFVLTILILLLNVFHDRLFIKSQILAKPTFFWGLWVIYSIFNLYFKGYNGELPFAVYFVSILFNPYLAMLIAYKEIARERKSTLQLLTIIFTIYVVLSIIVLGNVSYADADEARFIGELGNLGPLNAVFIIFFAGLLFVQEWLRIKSTIPLIIFTFIVIAMSGTRKAFGGAIILTMSIILSKLKPSIKNILLVAVLGFGLYMGYQFAMESTSMGDRFQKGLESGEKLNTSNVKALNFLGDRAGQYITSWEVFLKHPITGIGLNNFQTETRSFYRIHSEYMVQLAEGGLIGSVIFLLFYFWIGGKIVKYWIKYNRNRSVIWILAGAFASVLFINFTAWTYSFPHYFIVFGTIIGFLETIKNENCNPLISA